MYIPGVTRRTFIAASAGFAVASCVTAPLTVRLNSARRRIEGLVDGGDVPAAGLVVMRGGERAFAHAAGLAQGMAGEAPALSFTPTTKMRVASVSKLATALTAHRLAEAGIVDLDADVSNAFAVSIRHPGFPDSPVTLRHLLGHTAGLEDPDTYWIAAPRPISDLFVDGMWRKPGFGPPGTGFRYSNFGYGLAATLLERRTGERFDRLAQRLVFGPAGLTMGFNWSGVAGSERARGASIYRKVAGTWNVEADGPGVLRSEAPAVLLDAGFELADYVPGTNGTLFSPQGGLRASLEDLCRLVREIAGVDALDQPLWRFRPDAPNGDTEAGYFTAFSAGAHIHDSADSPLSGYQLIGHHGEAYGLYCGAWHVPALDAEFAYAINGTPDGEPARARVHPAANVYTAELFAAAAVVIESQMA